MFFRHTLVDLIIAIGATKISFIGQEKKTVNLHVRSLEQKHGKIVNVELRLPYFIMFCWILISRQQNKLQKYNSNNLKEVPET